MPFVSTWGQGVCWPCEHQLGRVNPIDNYARPADVLPKAQIEYVILEKHHTYLGGQVLGQVTRTGEFAPYDGSMITGGSAPVLSQGGSGALLTGMYEVHYTYLDAVGGESLPSDPGVLFLAAHHELHVAAITPLPPGVISVNWYLCDAPNSSTVRLVTNNAGQAFDLNVLPGGSNPEPPTTPTAFVHPDGRHAARAIQKYPAIVDDAGIWVGADLIAGRSEWGKAVDGIEVWWSGVFKTADLIGLDSRAVTQLGRLVSAGKIVVLGA